MKGQSRIVRIVSVVIFSMGVLLGMAFYSAALWGDLEAFLFDSSVDADASLSSLRCPVLIATTESGVISASVRNPIERPIRLTIRTHISEGFLTLFRESVSRPTLEPGEKQRSEWTVTEEDAVYGFLVLARVFVKYPYPLPARTAACGVLVLDLLGFTGIQVSVFVVVASLLFMVAGWRLWTVANRPLSGRILDATRAMGALTGIVLAGIATSLLGWWLLAGLFLVVSLLLIGAVITFFVQSW